MAHGWADGATRMSIAWGPWSETGAAVRADVLERNRERGLDPLSTAEGMQWLEHACLHPGHFLVGARVTQPGKIAGSRSARFVAGLATAVTHVLLAGAREVATGTTSPANVPFLEQLATLPAGARRTFVTTRVKARVRKVLGLPADAPLDTDRPLGELGLDSLLAVELRNVLGEDLERRLPATLLFDHPTTAALADHLLSLLEPEPEPVAVTEPEPREALAVVDALSDDDVDRLLAEKLYRHE